MSKTLTKLVHGTKKRVYIHLPDKESLQAFIVNADLEGFTFAGGKRISEMALDNFYVLNKDMTVNYINFVGRLAYQCKAKNVSRMELYAKLHEMRR